MFVIVVAKDRMRVAGMVKALPIRAFAKSFVRLLHALIAELFRLFRLHAMYKYRVCVASRHLGFLPK